MEDVALKVVDSLDVGNLWPSQLSAGRDQHVELARLATVERDGPAAGVLIERRRRGFRAKPQVFAHPEAVGDLLHVVEDLLLRRVAARPVVSRRERERVQMRRHIAGRAGVCVRAPDTADRLAALEDLEVLDPFLPEADPHADAAEARTYHSNRDRA